jgi:hypothetical protein
MGLLVFGVVSIQRPERHLQAWATEVRLPKRNQ